MFTNIGRKIKALARVLCWIGILASVLCGGLMIAASVQGEGIGGVEVSANAAVIAGVAFAVVGSLLSWIGSFFAYGFGELIESASEMAGNMANKY